jgi:hypothetical protein
VIVEVTTEVDDQGSRASGWLELAGECIELTAGQPRRLAISCLEAAENMDAFNATPNAH